MSTPTLTPLTSLLDSNLLMVLLAAGNNGAQGTTDTIGTIDLAAFRTYLLSAVTAPPPLNNVIVSSVAGQVTGQITTALMGIITKISSDQPTRIRIYPTAAARDADLARLATTPSPAGDALIFEGITTSTLLAFNTGPTPYFFNGDTPATNTLYYTLEPTAGAGANLTMYYYGLAYV